MHITTEKLLMMFLRTLLLLNMFFSQTGATSLTAGHGEMNDWVEGNTPDVNGANRTYYNAAAKLKWDNRLGDWRDANNISQGDAAYANTHITDTDKSRFIEWDVSELVLEWANDDFQNQGFFLRLTSKGGVSKFASRESSNQEFTPQLVVQTQGRTITIAPSADTFLSDKTFKSNGHTKQLVIKKSNPILLRFPIPSIIKPGQQLNAKLKLYTIEQFGTASVGVFRSKQGFDLSKVPIKSGIAAQFDNDKNIVNHPSVIFYNNFESLNWDDELSGVRERRKLTTTETDTKHKFSPLQGKALKVKLSKNSHKALDAYYKFANESLPEPEEIYFRYYLRFGDDWNQTSDVGKLPGISGTYGNAGWGGRKSNGENGWSARGVFDLSIPKNNPLGGRHLVGSYFYYMDQQGRYGDSYIWNHSYEGFLESNRWYSIEQYVKLNTPGQKDGVFIAWVDGRQVFEKSDLRFRNTRRLKIEQIWMNVYHGGSRTSPRDQHLYIDNVVIAHEYIGPMKK